MALYNSSDITINASLLNSLQAHVGIIDSDGKVLQTNSSWNSFGDESTLIKRTPEGNNFFDTLQQAIELGNDYALKLLLGTKKVINGKKESFSLTYPVQTKANTFWFKFTMRSCNGNRQFVIVQEDMSSSVKAEYRLEENQNRYQIQFEQSVDGIFITDTKGNIIDANPAASNILGYTREELINCKRSQIADVKDPKYQQALSDRKKTGTYQLETNLIHKNGHKVPVEISSRAYRTPSGKLRAIVSFRDISRRKEMERENRENQIKLQQLFDSAPIGIAIADTDNKIIQVNTSFEQMFGFDRNEVIQKNINDIIVPDNRRDKAETISQATQNGQSMQIETVRLNKNGEEVPVLLGSVPVELNNEIIAIYGIYVDISQQQEYQHKIEVALREKDILLAELHHRVKNNLALINSLLELHLFDSQSPKFDKQLVQIKNRILTIASIHEVLYKNGTLNKIPFGEFLDEFILNGGIRHEKRSQPSAIDYDTDHISLTIDQSIPCGLLLNEILSLIFEHRDKSHASQIAIKLREYGNQIHLIVEGNKMIQYPKELRNSESLHNILIDPLVKQLQGKLLWPNCGEDYQKFELIFTRANNQGPARDLLKE